MRRVVSTAHAARYWDLLGADLTVRDLGLPRKLGTLALHKRLPLHVHFTLLLLNRNVSARCGTDGPADKCCGKNHQMFRDETETEWTDNGGMMLLLRGK